MICVDLTTLKADGSTSLFHGKMVLSLKNHMTASPESHKSAKCCEGLLSSIINPTVLLSPLSTQEAVLSSRIEGTQASLEEVLQYEADSKEAVEPSKEADFHEIINYRKAMGTAVQRLKELPLCLSLIKELHAILLDSVRGRNRAPGEFRRIQNFIGPPGCTIDTATFVPPSVDVLKPALYEWEKYCHDEEKDRLVQLAVVKAQFELIHPFLDGNGRLGRMLVPLFLYEKGLLSSPMFYMSAYLETNRELYYERLKAISRDGDWNGWIDFFLTAVAEQAVVNTEKARKVFALHNRMKEIIPDVTRTQFSVRAIDTLFDRPIFLSSGFVRRSGIPKASAARILTILKNKGILTVLREGIGRRATIFSFQELLEITG
jgi:Fic family protein